MKSVRGQSLNQRQFFGDSAKTVGAFSAFPAIITYNVLGGCSSVSATKRIVFTGIDIS